MNLLKLITFSILYIYLTNAFAYAQINECRLGNAVSLGENVAIGFPRLTNRAKSLGILNVTVLFVDFSDAPAQQTPQQVFSFISPTTENFISHTSYSKLKIQFLPYFKWLRMSKTSTAYAMSPSISFTSHRAYMTEAASLASNAINFSTSDEFIVLTNPLATSVAYGPAFCSSPGWGVTVNGKEFINGVTSGKDITYWSTFWFIHEFAHTLGLPDLYAFTGGVQFAYTGGWSIMGNINANAREFFAWERWLLGWLSDTQVSCLSSTMLKSTFYINLSPIELATNTTKMAVIKLGSTKALVVESRRSTGFDVLSKQGVLVYLVDTSIRTGSGPIQVLPLNLSDGNKMNSILSVGQSITYANVQVTLESFGSQLDLVKIVIN